MNRFLIKEIAHRITRLVHGFENHEQEANTIITDSKHHHQHRFIVN